MYVEGTSAYKLDVYKPTERKKEVRKKNVKKQKKARKVKSMLVLLFVFGVALFALARNVVVYDLHSQIEQNETELAKLVSRNEQTQLELNQIIDLNKVEEYATLVLGMQKPNTHQIIYLQDEKGDTMEKMAKVSKNHKTKGIFGVFSAAANTVKEYLN